MSKSLLLDFDGVLFRNTTALKQVERRSMEFTQNKVPGFVETPSLNYHKYGHTVHMINRLRFDQRTTLKEYNDFVFSADTMDQIFSWIDTDDLKLVDEWKMFVADTGMTPYVFSNAPSLWVHPLLERLHMVGMFEDDNVITSDRIDCLKPSLESFEKAIDMSATDKREVWFVDDSEYNVSTAKNLGIPSSLFTGSISDLYEQVVS